MNENYKQFIEERFDIVDKRGKIVSFILNTIQDKYLTKDSSGQDYVLKARQQGFSSLILAIFSTDFLAKENSYSVVVADIDDNAEDLLHRVKFYLRSYEEKTGIQIPLKYNSKSELYNEDKNSRYKIGTAQNVEFGRSKTVTNLHLSEFNFYNHPEKMIASAGQAVVEGGRVIIETTANGFNEGKTIWDDCVNGERPYKPLFYKASDFYSKEFLENKKKELKRLFPQEYPESAEEAFLTSGECYFEKEPLREYLDGSVDPIKDNLIYV